MKTIPSICSGIAVGLIALIAWPMSISTGRDYGLGITTPSKFNYFLITGDTKLIDWGVLLILGIFLGSYIALKDHVNLNGDYLIKDHSQ